MRFTDPTGMVIDSLSQGQWNAQKDIITNRRDNLVEKNKEGKNDARIASLNSTLNNMSALENSTQVYGLNKVNNTSGELKYDAGTGKITIGYTSSANFVHELTHGAQFESGDIGFNILTGMAVANDLWDEAAAYKAQYQFAPSSIGTVNNVNEITPLWVSNIVDTEGKNPYATGGWAYTGQQPLNANSGAYSLMMAYPAQQMFYLQILGSRLRNFTNLIFK